MRKIATTTELQTEIRRLISYAQSDRPSRVKLAGALGALSKRVAAGPDVSTPELAARVIESKLSSLFSGAHFKVEHQRGVGIEFARIEPEQHAKLTVTGKQPGPNMRCRIVLAPDVHGSSAWQNLNVKFGGTPDEIREMKDAGVNLRRMSGATPEKAVDTVIKWFTANASKLKG